MDNKEKVGYNAIKSLYKKIYKEQDDEENETNKEQEEKRTQVVIKRESD